MSWSHGNDPDCNDLDHAHIDKVITGRARDIGAFTVRRVLPAIGQRMIGPFIFFDHMGPAQIPPGQAMNVRPHPHINLATVTYLFEGEIIHRDSLGSHQPIRPGAINWMTAGRGIVHSERTSEALRATGTNIHGIQLWVALPTEHEEVEPAFIHYPADTIPELDDIDGASVRVLCGRAFGMESPVATLSPLLYLDVRLPVGTALALPADYRERAAYVVAGGLGCGDQRFGEGELLVLSENGVARLQADPEMTKHAGGETRVMIIGGEPLDGKRHIFWNFVSSSNERLKQVKADWAKGPGNSARFPKVPGDEDEFIPLPT